MSSKKIVKVLLICGIILLMDACAFYNNTITPVVTVPDANYVGSEECAVCHEDVFVYYRRTVHYKVRSFEVAGQERGCEGCHGPGSAHIVERGNIEKIITFSKLTPAQSAAICLKCHGEGSLMHWSSSYHSMSDIGCNECHKSHKITEDKMLYKGEPELCYDCHQQVRVRVEYPSHHPIREGKMKCSECHNTHGAEPESIRGLNVNQLCYECHAEKQGPFVFDHPPVEEDCALCHDAHGAIANNLLIQSEPFLCLRCHTGHRGDPATGAHPSIPTFLTSCTQCHSQIHGSDLPSQLGRDALTR